MYKSSFVNFLARSYGLFIAFGDKLQGLFLLWMRLTWGHQFYLAGSNKLSHFAETAQYFSSLNIPHPEFHTYLVSYTEMIGGALLIIGFCSRLISIPLAIAMLTALATAHAEKLSQLHFITHPATLVHEAPYPYLITALLVLIFGPGGISVDGLIKRWIKQQPQY